MIIKNASVFTEEGKFAKQDIFIKDGKFVVSAEEADGEEIIDAKECFAVPGLTDIHFHGCMGHDFCDGTREAITAMAEYEASVGVTSIVPATMTLGEDTLQGICEAAAAYVKEVKNDKAADLCGINMEGPFVAASKKGAQNGAYIRKPDVEMFDKLNRASGNMIKLVAIAPEVEDAMEFIKAKKDETVLSVAHTATDYDTAMEAFEKGATHVTHLYNAMNPYTHRAPGPIAAAGILGQKWNLFVRAFISIRQWCAPLLKALAMIKLF